MSSPGGQWRCGWLLGPSLETLSDDPSSSATPHYGVSSASDVTASSAARSTCRNTQIHRPSSSVLLIRSGIRRFTVDDEGVELAVLKTMLSAVRSTTNLIRADWLNRFEVVFTNLVDVNSDANGFAELQEGKGGEKEQNVDGSDAKLGEKEG